MAWLASDCAVLPLQELVEGARHHTLPNRAVALTFDDGYLDTLTNASADPVAAHGFPRRALSPPKGSTALTCSGGIAWRRSCSATARDQTSCCSTCPMARAGWLPRHRVNGCSRTALCITRSWRSPRRRATAVLAQIAAWAPDVGVRPGMPQDVGGRIAGARRTRHQHRRSYRPPPPTAQAGSRATQVREMADSRVALERITGAPVTQPGVSLRRLR